MKHECNYRDPEGVCVVNNTLCTGVCDNTHIEPCIYCDISECDLTGDICTGFSDCPLYTKEG